MNTHALHNKTSENSLRQWASGIKQTINQRIKLARFAAKVHRERKQLLALSDEALNDMGISRCDAIREANKGLFDLPDHKKRKGTSD